MSVKYTHQELNNDVYCPSGFYTPEKEIKLRYNNKEVLCVIGQAVMESSCCGASNWTYALVPGYVISWQNETNAAGMPVSEVESISDEAARSEIRKIIQEAENINPVEFW